jgi:hypothetical protein
MKTSSSATRLDREQVENTASVATPAPAVAPDVERVPVEEVLRQIRVDSHREAERYLDETAVPRGGE